MKKILIIDDEEGIVEEVVDFLEEEGFDVKSADMGKPGIELFREFQPDLLLLDMKLPDMSGIEILELVKKESPLTKVIVNTGYVDQDLIDRAEELGRDAFLQKPFDLMFLIEEVNRVLEES